MSLVSCYHLPRRTVWDPYPISAGFDTDSRPSPSSTPLYTGEGGATPLSLSLSLSFLPPASFLVGLGKDESYSY